MKVENAKGAPYNNGGAVMTAFEAGDVDIGYLGSPPAIIGHVNGLIPTKVIGQVNSLGSALVVREGIITSADLVGKTIVEAAIECNMVHERAVIYFGDIPHAQIVKF